MVKKSSFFKRVILAAFACPLLLGACSSSEKLTGTPLPKNFPLTGYPKSECTTVDMTPVGKDIYRFIVVMKSTDDKYKILQFYKTDYTMHGFQVKSDYEDKGVTTLTAESDKATSTCTVTPLPDGTIQVISLYYSPKI